VFNCTTMLERSQIILKLPLLNKNSVLTLTVKIAAFRMSRMFVIMSRLRKSKNYVLVKEHSKIGCLL
jgi:hypothetical protein